LASPCIFTWHSLRACATLYAIPVDVFILLFFFF
jgi:hypothetical protein